MQKEPLHINTLLYGNKKITESQPRKKQVDVHANWSHRQSGRQCGKAVRVVYNLPVNFKLQ